MRWERFNAGPDAEVAVALSACCASPQWVRQVVGARPYGSPADLHAHAAHVLAGLCEDEVGQALAGHPRIGERSASPSSQREQAGVTDDVRDALAAGNRAYEERFGHVYLVCADGRSGAELLAVLHERLRNDAATERRVLRGELGEITALRLARLLDTP